MIPHKIPPGRPIVSDCGSESYRVAEFVDYFIGLLAKLHPSYIKDTYDFVSKLRSSTVPADSFLFTIDVGALYTNIDSDLGLAAVQQAFARSPRADRPDSEVLNSCV